MAAAARVGPIGVARLAPFLPGSPLDGEYAVSATPFGSAGILPITMPIFA